MSISDLLIPNHFNVYSNSLSMNTNSVIPPSSLPNNVLWIQSPTGHLWRDSKDLEANPSPAPSAMFGFYVNKAGSDITGDGSILNPYLTVTFAMSQVTVAGFGFPFGIFVGPGIYVEANLPIKANVFIIGSGQDVTRISITTSSTLGTGWDPILSDKSGFENLSIEGAGALTYDFSIVLSTNGIMQISNCIIYSSISAFTFTGNVASIANLLSMENTIFDVVSPTLTLNNCRFIMNSSRIDNVVMNSTIAGLVNIFSNSALNNLSVVAGALDTFTITAINSTCGGLLNLNGPITVSASVDFMPVKANVTLAAGASIGQLNDSYGLAYTPSVGGDWPIIPLIVQASLDELAANLSINASEYVPVYTGNEGVPNTYTAVAAQYLRVGHMVNVNINVSIITNAAAPFNVSLNVPIAAATNLAASKLILNPPRMIDITGGIGVLEAPILTFGASTSIFTIIGTTVLAGPANVYDLSFNYSYSLL